MLAWFAQETNEYIQAFRRHDSDQAKAKRNQIQEQYNAAKAPERRRNQREQNAKKTEEKQNEAARKAKEDRKNKERQRKVENKFR